MLFPSEIKGSEDGSGQFFPVSPHEGGDLDEMAVYFSPLDELVVKQGKRGGGLGSGGGVLLLDGAEVEFEVRGEIVLGVGDGERGGLVDNVVVEEVVEDLLGGPFVRG